MPEEYFAINHSMSRRTPSTMDSAGILAEVVALNGAKGTITLGTGTWRIDLATVTPTNVRLVPEQGAMLTKYGSGTLTINGPFDAPLAQVFSGFAAGEVTFGPGSASSAVPQWWGADGSTGDATSAVTCAARSGVCEVFFPPASYAITSVDLTRLRYVALRGVGRASRMYNNSAAAGKCMLDCTGAVGIVIQGFEINGSLASQPRSAILIARDSTNDSSGNHKISQVTFTGYFDRSAIIGISSEENTFREIETLCWCGSDSVSITDQNPQGAASDFATFPATWMGGNTQQKFLAGSLINWNTASSSSAFRGDNIRGLHFLGTFFSAVSGQNQGIKLNNIEGLNMQASSEWADATHGAYITGYLRASLISGSYGNDIYGDDTSSLEVCDITGAFYATTPISVYDMSGCKIRLSNPSGTPVIRNGDYNNDIDSQAYGASRPTGSQAGRSYKMAARSDGQWMHNIEVANLGEYERLVTQRVKAALFQYKTQDVSTVASGVLNIDPKSGGCITVNVDHDVVVGISTSYNFNAPVPGESTWDQNIELVFVFRQDSVGGHAVTFMAGPMFYFYLKSGFSIDTAANSVTVVKFIYDHYAGLVQSN